MKRLPGRVAVRWSDELVDDAPYLEVWESAEEAADMNEKRVVGIYKLEKTVVVEVDITQREVD